MEADYVAADARDEADAKCQVYEAHEAAFKRMLRIHTFGWKLELRMTGLEEALCGGPAAPEAVGELVDPTSQWPVAVLTLSAVKVELGYWFGPEATPAASCTVQAGSEENQLRFRFTTNGAVGRMSIRVLYGGREVWCRERPTLPVPLPLFVPTRVDDEFEPRRGFLAWSCNNEVVLGGEVLACDLGSRSRLASSVFRFVSAHPAVLVQCLFKPDSDECSDEFVSAVFVTKWEWPSLPTPFRSCMDAVGGLTAKQCLSRVLRGEPVKRLLSCTLWNVHMNPHMLWKWVSDPLCEEEQECNPFTPTMRLEFANDMMQYAGPNLVAPFLDRQATQLVVNDDDNEETDEQSYLVALCEFLKPERLLRVATAAPLTSRTVSILVFLCKQGHHKWDALLAALAGTKFLPHWSKPEVTAEWRIEQLILLPGVEHDE